LGQKSFTRWNEDEKTEEKKFETFESHLSFNKKGFFLKKKGKKKES
jgi:hypothetical protein